MEKEDMISENQSRYWQNDELKKEERCRAHRKNEWEIHDMHLKRFFFLKNVDANRLFGIWCLLGICNSITKWIEIQMENSWQTFKCDWN